MITLLAKLLKILNSEDSPAQIALAVVLAAIIGLTPLYSVHNIGLFLIVLIVRLNLSMFLISFAVFTLLAFILDPLSQLLGQYLLFADSLQALWTQLYQNSLWRLLAFNNTLVIGSFCLALLLSPIIFFATRYIVLQYRQQLIGWAKQTRLAIWLKGGKIVNAYQSLQQYS
ncbi:TIGR03546 family protein [Oceanicoccus sp. KOV_DT_Chl]|uniref:TIGR03546 family protein n=1 Tax=Oceanicoccus sp. KOV_DT_Chl TaxID=1904639 RepID=UPI000C7E0DDA|nr:TIGR03546 family protein [Oceanicoccus sp. KOV_DT_Chl]